MSRLAVVLFDLTLHGQDMVVFGSAGDQQVHGSLRRYGYGIDRRAVVRVHLEVEMRMDAVRVPGVADEADRLAGLRPSRRP